MTYVTQAQLEDRYGTRLLIQLSDRETSATGAIVTAVVDRAIADTDAMIDGYLQGRYALPLAEVPPLLTDIAGAIAIWKLHRKVADDKIRLDYEDAVRRLQEIARGTIRLTVDGDEPAGGSSGGVETNSPERPFTTETLKGYI